MIEFTFLKELMLIRQVHQKSVMLFSIGISWIILLSFNQMSVADVWFINVCNPQWYCYILNIKGPDYHCIISLNNKNEAIKLLQNADLTKKSGTL